MEFDVEHKPGKDVTAGTRVARKRRLGRCSRMYACARLRRRERTRLPRQRFVSPLRLPRRPVGRRSADQAAGADPGRSTASRSTSVPAPASRRSVESARKAYFRSAFFESRRYDLSRVGRYKLNRKLGRRDQAQLEEAFGLKVPTLRRRATARLPEDRSRTCSRRGRGARQQSPTCCTWCGQKPGYRLDDQDHFANRRIRSAWGS